MVSNVSFTSSQSASKNKTLKHSLNVGVTVAGIGATAYMYKKATDIWRVAQDATSGNNTIAIKIKNAFETLGEKVFKGKLGKLIERYTEANCSHCTDFIPKEIKFNKGAAALVATLSIVALGFLARGIYNAGKINAEK